MRAPLPVALALLLVSSPTAVAQVAEDVSARRPTPISREDLRRMLSSGTYARAEIAGMIRRACISFVPTATERELYRGLGADTSVLSAIDACLSPPGSVWAQPSELRSPASEAAPATFASVRPPVAAGDESAGEPPPDVPALPDSAASEPTARGEPVTDLPVDAAAEGRAEEPEVLPEEPEVLPEKPEVLPDEVPAEVPVEAPAQAPPDVPAQVPEQPPSADDVVPEADPETEVETPSAPEGVEAAEDTVSAAEETAPPVTTPSSETDPDAAAASPEVTRLRRLAAEAIARRDVEAAVRIRLEIISLAPEDPLAWFQFGESLASVGDREGARDAFIRAAVLDRAQRRIRP